MNSINIIENLKKYPKNRFWQIGEEKLNKFDPDSIVFFEKALTLEPNNIHILYRLGLACYLLGLQRKRKKNFLKAITFFKRINAISDLHFPSIWLWANTYKQLYVLTNLKNYLELAQKKFIHALSIANDSALGDFYWDYALVKTHIGEESGEPCDIKEAIFLFNEAQKHLKKPSADFFCDFAHSYIQLAYLINDNALYLQAIALFKKKTPSASTYLEIANAYTQLYINTSNETFFLEAHNAYLSAQKEQKPSDQDLLNWACLLGESGKATKDIQKIKQSIQLAHNALCLNPDDHSILAQWIEATTLLGHYTERLDLILQAENTANNAMQNSCESSDLWNALGITLSAKGKYFEDIKYEEKAIECYQKSLSYDRTNAESWHLLGITYMSIGEREENKQHLIRAKKFLQKALKLKPACFRLNTDLAKCFILLYIETNELPYLTEALYLFEMQFSQKWVKKNDEESLFYYAQALDYFGETQENEEFHLQALEYFSQLAFIAPDYPSLNYHQGLCWTHIAEHTLETQFFSRAMFYFAREEKTNPDSDLLLLEWGLSLINQAECTLDSSSAEKIYRHAEKKLRQSALLGNQHAYYHLACLYSLMHHTKLAMKFLIKSYKEGILPDVEDVLEDVWLENMHELEQFKNFISHISTQNI